MNPFSSSVSASQTRVSLSPIRLETLGVPSEGNDNLEKLKQPVRKPKTKTSNTSPLGHRLGSFRPATRRSRAVSEIKSKKTKKENPVGDSIRHGHKQCLKTGGLGISNISFTKVVLGNEQK